MKKKKALLDSHSLPFTSFNLQRFDEAHASIWADGDRPPKQANQTKPRRINHVVACGMNQHFANTTLNSPWKDSFHLVWAAI